MTFTLVDVILILVIFGFVFAGAAMGLIKSVGTLLGFFAGTWMAGRYFMIAGDWLTPILMGNAGLAKIVGFFLVFSLTSSLVNLIFFFLQKGFNLLSFIPFAKTINRLGGVILGLVEGVLFTGLFIFVLVKLLPESTKTYNLFNDSKIAHWLVD